MLPGPWWKSGFNCQHLHNKVDVSYAPIKDNQLPIIVLDGFWVCIRKQLFTQISYDEKLFNGFHFYDIDISMQIHQLGFKLMSVYDIHIAHESLGKLNTEWLKSAFIFSNKWRKCLPVSIIPIPTLNKLKAEVNTILKYLHIVVKDI